MPYLSATDTVLEHRWKMLFSIGAGMVVVLIILVVQFIPTFTFSSDEENKTAATKAAKELFEQHRSAGYTFTAGPCLSEELLPDWVVDVAHSPRIPADDLPENQCTSYREGRTHHVVELDLEGNLIRAE